MIFVTVGTHEQPFNRLIEEIDRLKGVGEINEEVIIQKGYSTFTPKNCVCYDLVSYDDMEKYIKDARIVITHGGPASFIAPLSIGKIPIVVPRQKKFNEHVNDHQLDFCKEFANRRKSIIVVEDIRDLKYDILNYDDIIANSDGSISSHNSEFCKELISNIKELFNGKDF